MTGKRKRREFEQRCQPKDGISTVDAPRSKINVNIIRAFEGPLHSRLEKIWERIAATYKDVMNLHVFDNIGIPRRHAQALKEIFDKEFQGERPETLTIFTEFDFLPEEGFFDPPQEDLEAAEYVTRDARTMSMLRHGIPGAWYVALWKPCIYRGLQGLRTLPKAGERRNLLRTGLTSERGRFRDPANKLFECLQSTPAIRRRLLESQDCYPDNYGCRTPGRGVHLFWSRHYNDQPTRTVAAGGDRFPAGGFGLAPILRGVKRYIDRYEKALDRSNGALPSAAVLAP